MSENKIQHTPLGLREELRFENPYRNFS